ncbi:MAG: L-aspartate oxidase [Chloroflexi bacterium]|nr:L-aspartate oxidase [Chloroflexota bacterium]
MLRYDYVIIGSGIAGLYAGLKAQQHGTVLVITKGPLEECNTRYAQGGIAAPIAPDDSPAAHMEDTLKAGAGLCDVEAVRILTQEAADCIEDLLRIGVPFDTAEGEVHLTLEGGHSMPRVLHAGGDATGKHIELTLSATVRASRVAILENCLATGLLVADGVVTGVRIMDVRTGSTEEVWGKHVVLATGGAGRLYSNTTNPEGATGDGVVLAYQAGADVVDMEFYQFHPTALHMPGAPPFLISEAMRGEGGILRNIHGVRFMPNYTPQAELAPRDVVARAIVQEMQRTGSDRVLLDMTRLSSKRLRTRFPTISMYCASYGLDITREPIPVSPAAHYMIGGVWTSVWGESSLPRLFACGEVACTGAHGANRLASNSLLEGIVFARRVIERTAQSSAPPAEGPAIPVTRTTLPQRKGAGEGAVPSLQAVQQLMWRYGGMIRDGEDLQKASTQLALWEERSPAPTDRPSYELRNLIVVGRLLVEAALVRQESRGAHYRTDYPEPSPQWERRIIIRKEG